MQAYDRLQPRDGRATATGAGQSGARVGPVKETHLSGAELRERLEGTRAPSTDDASITTDGRRLDCIEQVLGFLAEVAAHRLLLPVGPGAPAWTLSAPPNARSGMALSRPEPPPNIPRIMAVLNRHAVDYLLVGGVATVIHGAARPTGDVDCLVQGSAENLHRLAEALGELNARLRVGCLDDAEAALLPVVVDAVVLTRTEISVWRTDAGNVDVLTALPGPGGRRLRYDGLVERAHLAVIEGITALVASLDDVIMSKQWADRPKDRQVLPELRELSRVQIAAE